MSNSEEKKPTLEETMLQIEREAEAKVIKGYASGEIQMAISVSNGSTLLPIKNTDKQLEFCKKIMEEGSKKFEAAAGRPMTYLELRQMFG